MADIGRCANRNTWGVIQTPSPTLPTGGREIHETPSPTLPARGKDLEPILSLLRDPSLTEIMINGPDAIYVERDGRILMTDREFADENHLMTAIEALVSTTGRRLDASDPILEVRLLSAIDGDIHVTVPRRQIVAVYFDTPPQSLFCQ